MRRLLLAGAIAAVLASPTVSVAQQMMTPKDINYLATMSEMNRPYYESFVLGIARFSGEGTVDSTLDIFGHPYIEVDMGAFGQVDCMGVSIPGLKPGDKVSVTGSVGGASTAASVIRTNEDREYIHSKAPPVKVKDGLMLLAGTCRAEKVS
jgi:hypothetical protein